MPEGTPFVPRRHPHNAPTSERGIPTKHRGVNYRSRTEARWAVFFELMGWPAEYEPLDLDGYIPDFILAFPHSPLLIEIKAEAYVEDLYPACAKIDASGWQREALVLGSTPFLSDAGPWGIRNAIGYLRDAWTDNGHWVNAWGSAEPTRCTLCGTRGVCSGIHSYENRMCGHYDGDTYKGHWPESEIREVWADAINAVQWAARGRTA